MSNEGSKSVGKEMYQLIEKLYPICRSITGNGVRQTLKMIGEHIPLKIYEIPTGTKVFDWTVPKEWNIKDAYILDSKGNKIIDFQKSNLHVVNYSIPINRKISLTELKSHLFTLPDHPDWIPYLTTYYKEDWGFCLTYKQYEQLQEDVYEVVIDSTLENGHLTYGEYYLKGEIEDEVIITCYTCHPSLCNDNLSGVALVTFLAKYLSKIPLIYSYRFLFIPETIGAITWLSINEKNISRIKHGLVVTCVGDGGICTYKKSRHENARIDKVVINTLKNSDHSYKINNFSPIGSDERQFCSPGFNLPVGSLTRTYAWSFPEYHTSADNLEFIKSEFLQDSFEKYLNIADILENDRYFLNLNPKCEPQLGKRNLYRNLGGQKNKKILDEAIFWILNYSDGKHSLLDISDKSELSFELIKNAANLLKCSGLLKEMKPEPVIDH